MRLGLLLFAAASAGCAFAPAAAWLIGLRLVQGTGAALIVPGAVAILLSVTLGVPTLWLLRAVPESRADANGTPMQLVPTLLIVLLVGRIVLRADQRTRGELELPLHHRSPGGGRRCGDDAAAG